jgi:integrase
MLLDGCWTSNRKGNNVASVQPKQKGRGGKKAGWRVSYRDHENKQRSKSFDRKADAERFRATVEADKLRGTYVDPRAGKITLNEYAETYMAAQVWRAGTRAKAQSQVDNHIGPALGNRQLATITRTDVQAFVSSLTAKGLAPTTVQGVHVRLVSFFEAAVHDGRIVRSPAVKIRLPTVIKTAASQVVALDLDDVRHIAGAAPPHLTAFVWLIATAGLRPGEAAGLTVERINFLEKTIDVDRQMVTPEKGAPHLGPTKTSASVRTVPINGLLVAELNRHMRAHPPVEIEPGATLIFTNSQGRPLRRDAIGASWRKLRHALDLPAEARGWHSLRHTYASALIHAGLSVKTVQARLGHASATETLEVYSHLWPDSDDDTRAAIDVWLSAPTATAGHG